MLPKELKADPALVERVDPLWLKREFMFRTDELECCRPEMSTATDIDIPHLGDTAYAIGERLIKLFANKRTTGAESARQQYDRHNHETIYQ